MADARLKELERAWKDSVVPENMKGTFNTPAGDYVFRIQDMSTGDSKKGNYQATCTMEVESGPLPAGTTVKKFYPLYATKKRSLAEQFVFVKADLLRLLGKEPATLDDAGEAMRSLKGLRVAATVKKVPREDGGEFTNIWFNKVLKSDAPSPAPKPTGKAAAPKSAAKPAARVW